MHTKTEPTADPKRERALRLLTEKAQELGRPPQRADFDAAAVSFIKSKLGPWPRALEAAGLKDAPLVKAHPHSRSSRADRAGKSTSSGTKGPRSEKKERPT